MFTEGVNYKELHAKVIEPVLKFVPNFTYWGWLKYKNLNYEMKLGGPHTHLVAIVPCSFVVIPYKIHI